MSNSGNEHTNLISEAVNNCIPEHAADTCKKTVSIVISLYNEEECLLSFWTVLREELKKITSVNFEMIWVNDGSNDGSQSCVNAILSDVPVNMITHCSIEFSRNFGHEAAMIAGIDHSAGSAVICMDADGQHPPEELVKMVDSFLSGKDCVLMERLERADNSHLKKLLSSLFYRVINLLSPVKLQHNATDFFLISRRVADNLRFHYREHNRFIRGYLQTIGFSQEVLPFRAPRRIYGESKYSWSKMFGHALNAVFAFSNKPLRISILCCVVFILFTVSFGVYTLCMYLYGNSPPSGYTSIIMLLLISFSLLFFTIAVLSLYFEKVIREIRQRPVYIIKNIEHGNPKPIMP